MKGLFSSYVKTNEAAQIQSLLGQNSIVDPDSYSIYFAKGHISPDAAFVYDAEQDATYFYSNVAPQFQSFNNGNWKALERAVRDYATE